MKTRLTVALFRIVVFVVFCMSVLFFYPIVTSASADFRSFINFGSLGLGRHKILQNTYL